MISTLNVSHAGLVASLQHPTQRAGLRELMVADGGGAAIGELIAGARVGAVLIAPARSAGRAD